MSQKDDKDAREGWSYARETKFTQLMKKTKQDRKKFKEEKQQKELDRSRQFISEEKLEHYEKVSMIDETTGVYN
ncbi:MAG: hypothetical protein K2Z81_08930, partial [Cyanobacteria bacterium]|nr:hypothetical protein [Cyanobacteriota bacterium]